MFGYVLKPASKDEVKKKSTSMESWYVGNIFSNINMYILMKYSEEYKTALSTDFDILKAVLGLYIDDKKRIKKGE